jgi:hypothetical protein
MFLGKIIKTIFYERFYMEDEWIIGIVIVVLFFARTVNIQITNNFKEK